MRYFSLLLLLFCLGGGLLLSTKTTHAVPRMTEFGINETNLTCAEFFMGDEYSTCHLPDGWTVTVDRECPEGYVLIEADSVCDETPVVNLEEDLQSNTDEINISSILKISIIGILLIIGAVFLVKRKQ